MSDALITIPSETHMAADAHIADRILWPLRQLTRILSLILVAVMILLPAAQVALREMAGTPFVGAEELTRFMLICVVFLTFPYVVVSGVSIRLEEVVQQFPWKLRRIIHTLIAATGTVVFGIAATAIAVATVNNLSNATPTLGIPYWVFFSAAFVGFFLAAVECGVQLWKAVKGLPLYVTFEDEAPAEDLSALEASLTAQGSASTERSNP